MINVKINKNKLLSLSISGKHAIVLIIFARINFNFKLTLIYQCNICISSCDVHYDVYSLCLYGM